MKKKIALAAAVAASVPCLVLAAPQQNTELKACKSIENVSEADIKYLGDGVFLDADGNRVYPCTADGKVFFPIIGQVDNGVDIYQSSKSPAIQQNKIPASDKKESSPAEEQSASTYRLSYGDGQYDVEDIDEFRQAARKEELRAKTLPGDKKNALPTEAVLKALNLPANPEIPYAFKNSIHAEKMQRLKEDYASIMTDMQAAYDRLVVAAKDDLAALFAKKNRVYLSKRNIINQYGTGDADVSGIAYSLFDARYSAIDFLQAYAKVVDQVATTDSIDTRLALVEYIKEQDIAVMAGQYSKAKFDAIQNALFTPDKAEKDGYKLYGDADNDKKALFREIVSSANQKIMTDEYNEMPEEITKAQYKALSDIDRSKYAPIQTGKYVNHDKYKKRPKDKLINVPVSAKE